MGIINPERLSADSTEEGYAPGHPATFFDYLPDGKVQCRLCPRSCVLGKNQSGICRVRYNIDGELVTYAYNNPCAVNIDPVEKKPLFHVLPGSKSFSISTAGCNFRCKYCQNWQLSQTSPFKTSNYKLTASDIVKAAKRNKCETIAYTYGEPVIFYEYMLEIASLAKDEGIKNVMHSNGFIQQKPLRFLSRYLSAVNIDLKGMNDSFHARMTSGKAKPVLDSLLLLKEEGVHIEITRLLIPDENDSTNELNATFGWIYTNLGKTTPLHISRFFPMYQLTRKSPTPISTLKKARDLALNSGLKYVYVGNYKQDDWENTYCHNCGKLLIKRNMYVIEANKMQDGNCPYCNTSIPGVWS